MTIQLSWNGITCDLLVGDNGLELSYITEREQQRSASGIIETISHYSIIEGFFDAYFTEAVYQELLAWWSWAGQGFAFSFTMDTSKDTITTLDAGASSGQKVIPLTATTGFTAGDVCLIRSSTRFNFEVVTIYSVSAGVSVTAVSNLKYTYVSGDGFRHLDYLPNALILDNEFKPRKDGHYYRHTFHFIEGVDSMVIGGSSLMMGPVGPTGPAGPAGADGADGADAVYGQWGAAQAVTIASGVLALPDPGSYAVNTEGGAATDDLTQITGLSEGDEVVLSPGYGDRTVVVKNGTYLKLQNATDFQMDGLYDTITIVCVGSDTCKEKTRSSND